MQAPLPIDIAAQLATGLVVLDDTLRVQWLNDSLADLLEVGVRGLRGQPFAALMQAPALASAHARLRGGEPRLHLRGVRLSTLQQRDVQVDIAMQALDESRILLEVHALAPPSTLPTPLAATLRGFAHEVKNPLAGLRGAAQLLQRRSADAQARQLADLIIAEADRLAGLADRLLHQGTRTRTGAVNLHQLLQRVSALLAGQPDAPRLSQDYDPSLPDVDGDADRLQQLLLNLARNAVEAGASKLRWRTRVEHGVPLGRRVARSVVRVDLVDNGPGVLPALRDTLFQPLVSGRAEGTGLGLALARETALDHGGDLRHAERPEGTTFSLYLPLDGPA